MNRYALRVAIALLTFIIGVTLVAVWVVKWRNPVSTSVNPSLIEAKDKTSKAALSPETVDEYAVYSTVLTDPGYGYDRGKQIVVDQTMLVPVFADEKIVDVLKGTPELGQSIINDFLSKNKESHHLADLFRPQIKRILVSSDEIKGIFQKYHAQGWDVLRNKYPDTRCVMYLSRIGFNPERTQALVYVDGCNSGAVILLVKGNGVWKVQETILGWDL
jgi:hypothetical protein